MTPYGMVTDTKKCVGCHVCALACKAENNLPTDVWWNRILTDNGLRPAGIQVTKMERPLTLSAVFPKIYEGENSVNVKI